MPLPVLVDVSLLPRWKGCRDKVKVSCCTSFYLFGLLSVTCTSWLGNSCQVPGAWGWELRVAPWNLPSVSPVQCPGPVSAVGRQKAAAMAWKHNFFEGEGWKSFHFDVREKGSTCVLQVSVKQPRSVCVISFFNFFRERKILLISDYWQYLYFYFACLVHENEDLLLPTERCLYETVTTI